MTIIIFWQRTNIEFTCYLLLSNDYYNEALMRKESDISNSGFQILHWIYIIPENIIPATMISSKCTSGTAYNPMVRDIRHISP